MNAFKTNHKSKFQSKAKPIVRPKMVSRTLLSSAIVLAAALPSAVYAQAPQLEESVVYGTRATVQNSINLKRESVAIVDGLNEEEIGAIPAISIGDALETLTGATSHRENGGATEVSVRGLGPFLGTTVINGREATNGGGNRAVNYSIFPSEMFNGISIHKTQAAEYIEGAVSGQVHLETRKPIDYGKQLVQFDLKGAYSPDESDIVGGQDLGHRATFSYIDQFDMGDSGSFGLSFGYQTRDESNPEAEYTTTSGGGRLEACELESFDTNALPTDTSGRCHDGSGDVSNDEIQALIDGNPDYNSVEDIPFAYIPRDHRYRQNVTGDDREAFFGALQWRPNDRIDILFDYQYSERDQTELRNDLQFGTTQEDISALTSDPATGVVTSSTSETQIFTFTTDFQRFEEYEGYGLNVDFQVSENLELSFDYATSDTQRVETDVELRLGATDNNMSGGNRDDFTVQLDTNQGPGAGIATILDDGGNGFEVTDPSFFNARDRLRLRARQIIRDNTIDAFRSDFKYNFDGPINALKGGFRVSTLDYFTRGGNRNAVGESFWDDDDLTPGITSDIDDVTDAILVDVLACANDTFPESGFLSNVRDQELITNTSSGSSVSEFATFDFDCAGNALLQNYGGLSAIQFQNGITSGTNDVTEDTISYYLQADYAAYLGDRPVRGNFGVRIVDTEITSVGYRTPISVELTDAGYIVTEDTSTGEFETDTQKSGYTEVLPSITFVMDLTDDVVMRAGFFKGLSRPDPNAYGNGRSIQDNDESNAFSDLSEAINGISATGNPFLRPLTSMNYDFGLEWYPTQGTLLGAALYYKEFKGGFENVAQQETFNLDGNVVTGLVETTQTVNDESTLQGFEITAAHSFDYLPGFLGGLGAKFSYNYADSNFEFEDQHGGDGISLSVDPETGVVTETPLIGILEPADLFGLSDEVSSTQLFWSGEKIDFSVIYKTRSQYFQQFTRDTQGRIRYTADNETLDLTVSYQLNDNVKLSFEGKNIMDEPRVDFRAIDGNILQALSYGPRYFMGVKVKF